MNNFLNLLRNEHMKIYKKLSTYIMMGILILIIITIGTLVKIADANTKKSNNELWKNDYQAKFETIQNQISDNNITNEQKAELKNQLNYIQYCMDNNIAPDTWKSLAASDLQNLKQQMEATKETPLIENIEEQCFALEDSIKNGDWKQYLLIKKSALADMIIAAGNNQQAIKEYQISLDTIELRLEYNIPPDEEDWKNQDILSMEDNKRTLYQLENSSGNNKNSWIIENRKSLEQSKITFSNRIKMAQYRIQNNMPPSDMEGTQWEFMKDLFDNMINIIIVFVVIICSGIVAGEFTDGTIKQMLIRPYKRWEILMAKYITVFIYTLEMMVVLIVTSYVFSGIFYGFSSPPTFLYMNEADVVTQNFIIRLLFESALNLVPLIMISTMAFMISTVFKNNGLSIGISLLLLFIGGTIVQILAITLKFTWTKFILFSNWNILHYFTEGMNPVVEGMTLIFSITVLAVYFIVFNLVTLITFTKRDITT